MATSILPQTGPNFQDPADKILSLLHNVKAKPGGGWQGSCPNPAHQDTTPSLSIDKGVDGRVLLKCFAGCSVGEIVDALGLTMADLFPSRLSRQAGGKGHKAQNMPGQIVATYDYTDAAGKLLYQVCRMEPGKDGRKKDFAQRQPCPKGGNCGAVNKRRKKICKRGPDGVWWHWNMAGINPLPYRLPELQGAIKRDETVFVVEGEKDVDNLARIGLVATCNHGGAGNWTAKHSAYFPIGTEVVVLPDNDEPGREHARKVANQLISRGCRVKVLELPDLPEKGDVSDWLATGHSGTDLLALVNQASYWEPTVEMEPTKTLPPVYDEWKQQLAQTGLYTVEWPGYLCYDKETSDGKIPIQVSNFLARPVAEITRDDGREQTKTFTIEGILAPGHPLRPVDVPAKDFSSMSWVPGVWGLGAALEPSRGAADRVRHCIQRMAYGIPRQTIFTHLGWRKIGARWVYLHAGGTVGADDVTVEPGEGLHRYALPGESDEAAMIESLKLLTVAPPEITIPLWAAVFLAPLCEPLRQAGIEPAFVLWVLGQSGTLKSTLAALLLSHFGEFSNKNLPGSFKDTENALEKRGFLAKDTLMVIDDFHPVADALAAKQMRKTAQALLRGYGDRVGRTRMRADTSIREGFPPRGLCVVTGEDIPDAGQSTTARYLAVEVPKGAVDMPLLTNAQAETEGLAAAMRGYLEWLAPKLDGLVGKLKQKFTEYREKATIGSQHGRMAEAVAWLYIGLHAGLDYAAEVGAVNAEERKDALAEGWNVLTALAEKQGRRIEEDKPSDRFCAILREVLASGTGYLRDVQAGVAENPATGFLGWQDRDWAYLLPEVAYKTVAEFSGRQGGHFPVTPRTLWKHLEADGLIEPEVSGGRKHMTHQKKIGSRNFRLVWVKAAKLIPGEDAGDQGDD